MTNTKPWKDLVRKGSDLHPPERIPTGVMGLDLATGGGWPLHRTVTLYGEYGTAKSTLTMLAVSEAQKLGYNCLLIDAEDSFTDEFGERNGVDIDKLAVVSSETIDDLVDLQEFVKEKDIQVVVIDSISMITSAAYFDTDDNSIGLNSRSVKNLTRKIKRWNHPLILQIAQTTMKFGGHIPAYPAPTSGQYVGFSSNLIVKLMKGDKIMGSVKVGDMEVNKEVLGLDIKWKIEKNKIDVLYHTGHFEWRVDGGIDAFKETVDIAVILGVIQKNGGFFSFGTIKAHGREKLMEELSSDLDAFGEVKNEVLKRI